MSIFQFIRIFIARWLIVVIATVSAATGAYIVAKLVQPRYESTSRLMLSFLKPDPVTGQTLQGGAANSYLEAQAELIQSDRVAGDVVDRLGWASDPGLIQAYQGRTPADTRDFRRWLAQRVTDKTQVGTRGSILTITYTSSTALEAKIGAETMRTAYLREALNDRQANALKYAKWFGDKAEAAKKAAEAAELAKTSYERETGIVISGGGDMDNTRLNDLSNQIGTASTVAAQAGATQVSNTSLALQELGVQIEQEGQRLGPNHPRMIELKRRREQLQALVSREGQSGQQSDLNSATIAAATRAYEVQKEKVLSQRDKIERLHQLQTDVDLRRDEYVRTSARSASLQLEASLGESGAVPLGPVLLPGSPVFPKKTLMVGGATALGIALGLGLALLLELLNRRVRSAEDLDIDRDIHCIGVIAEPGRGANTLFGKLTRRFAGRAPTVAPA